MASTPQARDPKPSAAPPLLVLGLSRTGGNSLSRALAVLGYDRLYDLDDVANGGAGHAAFWLLAVQRKLAGGSGFTKAEADALLDGYDGVRNVPAAAFAAELIRCYPASRVILPTRDVESWHVSCLATVYRRSVDPVLSLLGLCHRGSRVYASLLRGLQQVLYHGDFQAHGKAAFVEHGSYLRDTVPPELLLEYRVQQGWRPLCEFLGKEVPDCEFPQSNDRDAFWKGCRARDARVARQVLTPVLVVSGAVGLGWWCWLRGWA